MSRTCLAAFCVVLMLLSGRAFAGGIGLTAYEARWSPDGRWLGVGSTEGVWIFDTHDTEAVPLHYAVDEMVYVVAFDPVRPYVAFAAHNGEKVFVIDIETGEEIYHAVTLKGPDESFSIFYDVAYSDNGQYLSVLNTTLLYTLDAATGEELFVASADDGTGYSEWMRTLDYANNDTTVTVADWEGDMLTYTVKQPQRPSEKTPDLDGGRGIDRLEVIPGSQRVVLLTRDGLLLIYDQDRDVIANITPQREIEDQDGKLTQDRVGGFDMNAEGTQIVFGMSDTWFVYDVAQKTVTQEVISPSSISIRPLIYSLALNPQGNQVATLQPDGQFKVWDIATSEVIATWDLFQGGVSQKWG